MTLPRPLLKVEGLPIIGVCLVMIAAFMIAAPQCSSAIASTCPSFPPCRRS